uniref:Scavenger receptor class F member 2 n=2 Tax=Magallana gigas TaxID=29159 RepID=A0A8W8NWT5_MAGGI
MYFYPCLLYVAGLLVAFAYDDISYKRVASQSHTIIGLGNEASNAVDRKTSTCMRTLPIGRNNPQKTVWWKVDLGGVYNIQSINMLFKNYDGYEDRQRGRFAGFSLYVSNTGVIQGSRLCYKNGPHDHLPPLNFTAICPESGRYVIFYNERYAGVTYPTGFELENVFTELCEVIVKGCRNTGYYGRNCDSPCPTNCKDSTCHIQSGACFMCKPGWTDIHCNKKCGDGWYGLNCSQQCKGHCRDGATCNHVTGQCDKGC